MTSSPLLLNRRSLRFLRQRIDDREAELRQIIGTAACDQVTVDHYDAVFPQRACVDQVVFDGEKAR